MCALLGPEAARCTRVAVTLELPCTFSEGALRCCGGGCLLGASARAPAVANVEGLE